MKKRVSRQEDIAKYAVTAFQRHRLEKKADNGDIIQVWRCAEPGTGVLSFWVTILPYTVIVSGDIGDNILNVSDRSPLSWVVRVCDETTSYDYVASKIRTGRRTFDPEKAREWLQSYLDDGYSDDDSKNQEVRNILDAHEPWQEDDVGLAFYQACHDANLDPEDAGHDYATEHYWTIEALRAFSRLYQAQDVVKETPSSCADSGSSDSGGCSDGGGD